MRILQPNSGKDIVLIPAYHIYITIRDYGSMSFLKAIIIGPGQHTWEWIDFKSSSAVSLDHIDNNYCSFDNAINRAINDPYRTVYEFVDFNEVFKNWESIKYVDSITTIYKAKD